MKIYAGMVLVLLAVSAPCYADVTVNEKILQSGQYVREGCKADPKVPDYDECTCDGDVRYPELAGLKETASQEKLNAWFKEQAAKAVCAGAPVAQGGKTSENDKAHMSASVHYETTFNASDILALRFTEWAYTGGAHGNGSVVGIIVDLTKDKMLTVSDLFAGGNLAKVNQLIYEALSAKPEEEIFRDQIESRKGAFIKDGECSGCTLILTPDGVHVVFQTYEVAPYGAGNTEVVIPPQYMSYEPVKHALAAEKEQPQEKK